MSNVALIPARKGSQRIPRKNIRQFCGKPLIAWTIEAAVQSGKFASVVVSTDCPEIEEVSKGYGADVILRPESISQDSSPSRDVVLHFLELNRGVEMVTFLQPTSPLRTAKHIAEAVDLSSRLGATSVASCYLIKPGYSWALITNQHPNSMSQKIHHQLASENQSVAVLNGAIYLIDVENFLINPVFVSAETIPYLMHQWDSIDIDVLEDWDMAKLRLADKLNFQAEGRLGLG